jgi:DNA repair photolyase
MASEKLFELRRRTFDTPHFRGIEFIEVEAKSIVNRVPGSYLPFNWTINPYRGCSHACSYCMAGDTPILMADGRTKRLADVRVGDSVYGTERVGSYRRYVPTTVLDHWSTSKPAYRITLEDGTELVASPDHRFLSNRGWKFVTGSEDGDLRRPHLTPDTHLVGVGAFATREVREQCVLESGATVRVDSIKSLNFDEVMFDITTGTGDFIANGVVSHNCFARVTHTYMDMNAGRDFESKIVVKVNAPELLRKKLRSKGWTGEHIAMGTATDPYQRAEGRYKIMPRIIEALADYRNPFSILTKGTLILRDVELLSAAADVTDVSTALSIGTFDEDAWRRSEPGTPHPRKRMEAVARLNGEGIPCGVMVAPVLPGISDDRDMLRRVVDAAIDAGATHVTPILLHLRPVVREEYMAWLREHYPDLVESYEAMYTRAYAPKRDQDALAATVGALVAEAGPVGPSRPRRGNFRRHKPKSPDSSSEEAEQLRLI